MKELFVVARIPYNKPVDPQIIEIQNTGSGSFPHKKAAREYVGAKPGARLAVWVLGQYPQTFIVTEDGKDVHEGVKGF